MLTKFESRSKRVKGLSFHPKRPWILASLHDGSIYLWDYQMQSLLEKYEEHVGPVRGVDFHLYQPLFVSGGDDYLIKVWNYQNPSRRSLFTLQGHVDYIRTVQFHHEYPWILSASDDQTIRIWNWQSRSGLTVIAGHNHYVMCAQFHPQEDLVVSASLDQSVRVWDISGLRRKNVRSGPQDMIAAQQQDGDLFGADAVIKFVLEGHDRGVNWAQFHPNPAKPFIVSGADDNQVKVWRTSESRAWEVDSMRGHTNNVSSVLYHPKYDLIVSNSEDKTIRVWDSNKRIALQTFRRSADRFWIMAAHPTNRLLAAGHDSGMLVFKLQRERPAYSSAGKGLLLYVSDQKLRRAMTESGSDVRVADVPSSTSVHNFSTLPRELQHNRYNPAEENVLIWSKQEGGMYRLFNLNQSDPRAVTGLGLSVAFLSRASFVVLDSNRKLAIKDLANKTVKRIDPPYADQTEQLFQASTPGRVLVRRQDRVCLFETQSRRIINEISGVKVRYVAWSHDGKHVALMSKTTLVIATQDLTQVCAVHEIAKVKSAAWDENGVLVYSTLTHLKYLLPTEKGERGVLRTLDSPVYVFEAGESRARCMDRSTKVRVLRYDPTEYLFKQALQRKEYARVVQLIRTGSMVGEAVIGYLQRSGYPEVALHFVEDPETRFGLALACGNLDQAKDAAMKVDKPEVWRRLAAEALRQGSFDTAETAYQKVRDMDRLSFLYLISGQRAYVGRMMAIANKTQDPLARFHNALYLGDAGERVKVLEDAGQVALAYACARTYGLEEDAKRLQDAMEQAGLPLPDTSGIGAAAAAHAEGSLVAPGTRSAPTDAANGDPGAVACVPPTPIVRGKDWPLCAVRASPFEASFKAAAEGRREEDGDAAAAEAALAAEAAAAASGAWGGDDLDLDGDGGDDAGKGGAAAGGAAAAAGEEDADGEGGAWDGEADLDLPDLPSSPGGRAAGGGYGGASAGAAIVPTAGRGYADRWTMDSSVAAEHAAVGRFDSAVELLRRQAGIVKFDRLKPKMLAAYAAGRVSLPTLPSLPPLVTPLSRTVPSGKGGGSSQRPSTLYTLARLNDMQATVYRLFLGGKFKALSAHLDSMMASIPLACVDRRAEGEAVKQLLASCKEYKLACILTDARSASKEVGRKLELAAYLTHCKLLPAHQILVLNLAMALAYKAKNFIHAVGFARRLLEMPEAATAAYEDKAGKARRVVAAGEKQGRNAIAIDYDERNPFVLCGATLTPIYRGSPSVTSPLCGAHYKPEHAGEVCRVDGMSRIGEQCLGLVTYAQPQARRAGAAAPVAAPAATPPAASGAGAGGSSSAAADPLLDELADDDGW